MVTDTGVRDPLIGITKNQEEEDPIILESNAWIDFLKLKNQYWVRLLLNLTVSGGF